MDNFDLRKYLVENKVTTNSRMINEQENTKYFQLGYNYGPNAKLNIDPNMPEWKTISQLANDLYNTGVPLNSLEQNNAAVEFTKGYIASIATNRVRYQGLSSIINALGSVEENGHRENYLPGAEMMKEEFTDPLDVLYSLPDYTEKYLIENKVTTNSKMLNEDHTPDALSMTLFLEELGFTNDDLFDGVIESGDIYEAISLLVDVAGNGDERNPFDGVYTQSDFRSAAETGSFSEELIDKLLDMEQIRNLERG
jgi:hypothetical protein